MPLEPTLPFSGTESKILPRLELLNKVRTLRDSGRTIVFTNGCFDLVHAGHIEVLESARSLGDFLIVALNTDRSVQNIKGPTRPLVPEDRRAKVIAALACVGAVTFFDDPTPLGLISDILPDILVKGGDWTPDSIVGADIVLGRGGKVVSIPLVPNSSTTLLIERILERHRSGGTA